MSESGSLFTTENGSIVKDPWQESLSFLDRLKSKSYWTFLNYLLPEHDPCFRYFLPLHFHWKGLHVPDVPAVFTYGPVG